MHVLVRQFSTHLGSRHCYNTVWTPAYMTCWTCSFSFYLPCSSLTLCSIHTDNLILLNDTTPLPLCPGPCSTYDTVLIISIAMSLFINTYASLYLQVYIPCTL